MTAPLSRQKNPLRVSRFERVRSMLWATNLLVAFGVSCMFLLWLTFRWVDERVPLEPKRWLHVPAAAGLNDDVLEEPGPDEIVTRRPVPLSVTLDRVTELISTNAAILEVLDGKAEEDRSGPAADRDGLGDGPTTGGADGVPPWDRWSIRWSTTNVDEFARQLDFFGIELGVAGGRPAVDYAAGFAQGKTRLRKAAGDREDRIYMTWRKGRLKELSRQLLSRAGLPTRGRVLLQFLPLELERQLARLEAEAARPRPVTSILKTYFAVRKSGGGYEFKVMSQTTRPIDG